MPLVIICSIWESGYAGAIRRILLEIRWAYDDPVLPVSEVRERNEKGSDPEVYGGCDALRLW
ncbi:MAG: hypothetical protein ACLTXT_05080 [Ruminococcus callidus]